MDDGNKFSVLILLYSGFSNIVLSCLQEPLRALRDQGKAQINWSILTIDDAPATSSSGLRITPDKPCANAEPADLMIVVSGDGYLRHADRKNTRVLNQLARRAVTILGADTASWLLAAAGILTKGRATIHWQVLSDITEQFPELDIVHDRYVLEGRIWTCGGASAGLDLMLDLISDRFGTASAFDVSNLFLYGSSPKEHINQGQARLTGKSSAKLTVILREMASHLETPLPLCDLAARSGLSMRSLHRLFLRELDMSPGQYYQILKLSRARELMFETDLNLSEIALRCGFAGASSMSKSFRNTFGYSIGKLRSNGEKHRF